MPTKRAILSELTADELRANVEYYDLPVLDRRVKTELVDALAVSRKARLDEILPYLSRDRLKELCRAFGLDDTGREKAELAARLIGTPAPPKTDSRATAPPAARLTGNSAPPKKAGPDAPEPAPPPPPVAETPDLFPEKLSVAQLEQYLWSAADILRGSIDSSD